MPGEPREALRLARPVTVVAVASLGLAVHVVLSEVGELGRTATAAQHATWGWLLLAAGCSAATWVAGALALVGASGGAVPLRPTVALEAATAVPALVTPGSLGTTMVTVRFLERRGLDSASVAAAVGLTSAARFLTHLLLLVVVVPLAGTTGVSSFHRPDRPELLLGLVAGSLVVGIATGTAWGRRKVGRRIVATSDEVLRALRRPRQATQVFGGAALVSVLLALCLVCTVESYGEGHGLLAVAAVCLSASAVGAFSPIPGGLGTVEAALVGGLTAIGLPASDAVTAALTYRLLTFWLPAVPGAIAYRRLRRAEAL